MDKKNTDFQSNMVWNFSIFDQRPSVPKEVQLVSNDIGDWIEYVLSISMLFINIVAVGTNLVNIRVFLKQGVKSESTTISLLCLSISDLTGSLFLIPAPICVLLKLLEGYQLTHITCSTLTLITSTAIHNICFSIASWITVYMSVERSLCVLMPLKVKLLIRPERTVVAIAIIFIFFVFTNVGILAPIKILWMKHPTLGFSYAIPIKTKLVTKLMNLGNIILMIILNSVALVIVLITTSLMVYKLTQARKWRMSTLATKYDTNRHDSSNGNNGNINDSINQISFDSSNSNQNKGTIPAATSTTTTTAVAPKRHQGSAKDLEVVKTVASVTSIFLVCLSMGHIPSAVVQAVPNISFSGVNRNLLSLTATVKYLFDSINASVNFFFYVRVSSRYKATFYSLYPALQKQNN